MDLCPFDFLILSEEEIPRFQCFYIGALPESATSIMGDISKQLSWSMPPEKVCDKQKSKDQQICDLKYGECFG